MGNREKDIRRYFEYLDLGKEKRAHFLMFSELIDNAIGSFDKEHGSDVWGYQEHDKLKIDIKIYHPIDESKIKSVNKIEYQEDTYITVKDNAYGIPRERMNKVLRLNDKEQSDKTVMHVHGRGLKQSGFYLGMGIQVETLGKDGSFYVDNKPLEKGLESEVVFEYKEINKVDKGTLVTISPLRRKRRISEIKLKEIVNGLSERYWKLIESKRMTLKIDYVIEKNVSGTKEEFKRADIKATLGEDIKISILNKDEYIDEINKIIDNRKKNVSSSKVNLFLEYENLVDETSKKLESLILGADINSPFEWDSKINISSSPEESKFINVNFWSNSRNKIKKVEGKEKSGYSKYRGISIFQGSRAILHPPETEESKPYLKFMNSGKISGTADYKFAGELNIEGTEIETTTDKSDIEFEDPKVEENFNDQLLVVYQVFEIYLESFKKDLSSDGGEFLSINEAHQTFEIIENRFKKGLTKIKGIDGSILTDDNNDVKQMKFILSKKYNGKDESYLLYLNIDNKNVSEHKQVIKTSFNEGDEHDFIIDAKIFTGHPIWKKFNEKKNSFKDLISIFTMIFIIQEIIGRNEARSDNYDMGKFATSYRNPNLILNKAVSEDFEN